LSRPFSPRSPASASSFVRVNGKIRAREVRVIGIDGKPIGIYALGDAISLARSNSVDLVEVAPNATPPVCRLVDFGKYRYEQSKKDKEAKKHQHANKVKEIQLTATIDPHDFGVKLSHAIDFLCEEMKVKVALRFRGREMAHQEIGTGVVEKFIQEVTPYGHPDAPPKLIGKGLNVMLSPLPRNKRAKNPNALADGSMPPATVTPTIQVVEGSTAKKATSSGSSSAKIPTNAAEKSGGSNFANSPFSQLDVKVAQ